MNLNGKALSDLAHVTKAAVCKATKDGRLKRGPDGLYDPLNPTNASWIFDTTRKRGGSIEAVKAAARAAPEPLKKEQQTIAAIKERDGVEAEAYLISADFGSGFIPVVRYRYTQDDLELNTFFFPVPEAVAICHDPIGSDAIVVVYTLKDGKPLPTKDEIIGGNARADYLRGRS